MTTIEIPGWASVAREPAIFVRDYSFGPGRATSVAVRLPDGTWLLISPPVECRGDERAAFANTGGVSALLANNGAHHLGLAPWSSAFPAASRYAAPRAAARIAAKAKDAGAFAELSALVARLGSAITLIEMAGDKIGDLLVRIESERGAVLYVSDMVANFAELPKNPLIKLVFRLFDAAPGLKVFGPFFAFFVKDRAAAKACLVRELTAHPPAVLIPAHGDVAERPGLASELIGLLQA